jgi:DNA-binding NtrC family response regulator
MWILIANEDEDVFRVVARAFAKGPYRTHWARSWSEVEHFVSSDSDATLLLDPGLPGLTPEALRKTLSGAPLRPRVLLYGTASPVDLAVRSACFDVDGCLSTRVGPARLLSVVAEVWQRPLRSPPSSPPVPTPRANIPPRREAAPARTKDRHPPFQDRGDD